MEDGLHFVFLSDQVPVRFYRGLAGEPTVRVLPRHEAEAEQLELALGMEGGDGLVFRIALETDENGSIERVVFLALRGEGLQAWATMSGLPSWPSSRRTRERVM